MKKTKHLGWLRLCAVGAKEFSTCAKRQYMAVVLSPEGRVVGMGYNGGPSGFGHCTDGYCPRLAQGSTSGSNYDNCISLHAEENALLYSDWSARQGGTLVVNGPPCFGCAKKIAGSGVRHLVFIEDPSYAQWSAAADFLRLNKITLYRYTAEEVG